MAIALVLAGFLVTWQFVDPAPPDHFLVQAGAQDGAYYAFASEYRDILARRGVAVDVATSAGSVENLQRLRSNAEPAIAFVQGGLAGSQADAGLVALGSIYLEPLWLFHRDGVAIDRLPDLAGLRVAIGAEGSGTRVVAETLLRDNDLAASVEIRDVGGEAALLALQEGSLDALWLVAAPQSPLVQSLLRADAVTPMSFERAAAYTRRHKFLSKVTLPEGTIDPARNLPQSDLQLLAPAATLVAAAEFHPALVSLVLQAASQVHARGGLFEGEGEFPSTRYVDFPLADSARRFFSHGPPFLQRYLPFWAADTVDRLKIMVLPLLTLLVPLFKFFPPTYRWRVRKTIYRWYGQLEAIEENSADTREQRLARLDALEQELIAMRVPLAYSDELYQLRVHVDLVRAKLDGAGQG